MQLDSSKKIPKYFCFHNDIVHCYIKILKVCNWNSISPPSLADQRENLKQVTKFNFIGAEPKAVSVDKLVVWFRWSEWENNCARKIIVLEGQK